MTRYKRNNNKPWDKKTEKKMVDLIKKNTPTRVIGLKLGRSENSIYSRASKLGISLKPVNQSPYAKKNKKKPILSKIFSYLLTFIFLGIVVFIVADFIISAIIGLSSTDDAYYCEENLCPKNSYPGPVNW